MDEVNLGRQEDQLIKLNKIHNEMLMWEEQFNNIYNEWKNEN